MTLYHFDASVAIDGITTDESSLVRTVHDHVPEDIVLQYQQDVEYLNSVMLTTDPIVGSQVGIDVLATLNDLKDLARGINTSGGSTPSGTFYLTREMAEAIDLLSRSFKSIGLDSSTPGAEYETKIKRWKDLRGYGLNEIMKQALDAITSSRSIQAYIELEYITTANNVIFESLGALRDALTVTNDIMKTLNDLQTIHNELSIPNVGVLDDRLTNPVDPSDRDEWENQTGINSPEEFVDVYKQVTENGGAVNYPRFETIEAAWAALEGDDGRNSEGDTRISHLIGLANYIRNNVNIDDDNWARLMEDNYDSSDWDTDDQPDRFSNIDDDDLEAGVTDLDAIVHRYANTLDNDLYDNEDDVIYQLQDIFNLPNMTMPKLKVLLLTLQNIEPDDGDSDIDISDLKNQLSLTTLHTLTAALIADADVSLDDAFVSTTSKTTLISNLEGKGDNTKEILFLDNEGTNSYTLEPEDQRGSNYQGRAIDYHNARDEETVQDAINDDKSWLEVNPEVHLDHPDGDDDTYERALLDQWSNRYYINSAGVPRFTVLADLLASSNIADFRTASDEDLENLVNNYIGDLNSTYNGKNTDGEQDVYGGTGNYTPMPVTGYENDPSTSDDDYDITRKLTRMFSDLELNWVYSEDGGTALGDPTNSFRDTDTTSGVSVQTARWVTVKDLRNMLTVLQDYYPPEVRDKGNPPSATDVVNALSASDRGKLEASLFYLTDIKTGDKFIPTADEIAFHGFKDPIDPVVNTVSQATVDRFQTLKNNLQKHIDDLIAITGIGVDDVGFTDSLQGKLTNVLNDMPEEVTAETVAAWILDNLDKHEGDEAQLSGDIQANLTIAITGSQSLNDSQKEDVRRYMFLFEEFYKSASSLLQKISQMIEKMASATAR